MTGRPVRGARYRTASLLAGTVLVLWVLDLALGGGAGHTVGWLSALLLVAGIPALAARSAARHAGAGSASVAGTGSASDAGTEPANETEQGSPGDVRTGLPAEADPGRVVRPARPDELAELIEVERAADQLFPLAGYGPVPPPATPSELRAAAALLVSGDPATGYARLEVVDGRAHLEGLSVRPRFMRQGRGSDLVLAACDWASEHGFDEITLCTFAEVPWNGPFYARLGFVELPELTPGLRALRVTERALGLDAMGRRVVLVRSLSGSPDYLPDS